MTSPVKGVRRRTSRTGPLMASILVFLAPIGAAQAQDLCTNIEDLIDQSRSQFADIMDKPNGETGGYHVTLTLAGASDCSVTEKMKRSSYQCGWEFPLRAQQAYDTFDRFVREVNECIGQSATVHSDQSVNHPDYYALRRYEMAQTDVSVSVKDKSALGSTFVFIRVQGGPSN